MIDHWRRLVVGHRRQWLVVSLALVLGAMAGGAFAIARQDRYESQSTVYVAAQAVGVDPSAAYNGTLLSQEKVKSYVELLSDSRLTQEVAQRLGGGRDAAWVADHLVATSPTETAILRLTATDDSPQGAQALAAAAADSMLGLIAEIERPLDPGQPPPVIARIVQPATFSADRIAPQPPLNVAVGALAGLLIGVAIVLARRSLDRSVRSSEDLAEATSVPVLGTVARDPRFSERPLPVRTDRQSTRAEAYRQIRTNLQFLGRDRASRVLLVTSARHGEGKSVTAANLALALADSGLRVLLVGADLRRAPTVRLFPDDDDGPGLSLVLAAAVAPEAAIRSSGDLDLLPAGTLPPNPSELLGSERAREVFTQLRERYDYVLVDTPPSLLLADPAVLSAHVDGVILVARYGSTRSDDLVAAAESLRIGPTPVIGAVLTNTPSAGRLLEGLLDRDTTAKAGPIEEATSADAAPTGVQDDAATTSEHPDPYPAGAGDRADTPDSVGPSGEAPAATPEGPRPMRMDARIVPSPRPRRSTEGEDTATEPEPGDRADDTATSTR